MSGNRAAIRVIASKLLEAIQDVRSMEILQGREPPDDLIVEIHEYPTVAALTFLVPGQISNRGLIGDPVNIHS